MPQKRANDIYLSNSSETSLLFEGLRFRFEKAKAVEMTDMRWLSD